MITNESANDEEFDYKAEASLSSLFASGKPQAPSRVELHFDSIPPISYDESPCDWANILQPNIVGPFAPRMGWLASTAANKLAAAQCQGNSVVQDQTTTSIKDKAKPSSYFAKMLKKPANAQHQHVLEEPSKREKSAVDDVLHKKQPRHRQDSRFVCHIGQGSRVSFRPQFA